MTSKCVLKEFNSFEEASAQAETLIHCVYLDITLYQ